MSGENLFERDLSKMDYMQLAEWLSACYDEVGAIRDEHKNDTDYFTYLKRFTDAWERHYEQNKGLYRSKKFKLARLFTTYKGRVHLKVHYGKGRKNIQEIPFDSYSNFRANEWVVWKTDKPKKEIEEAVSAAYQSILNVFLPENIHRYKILLHEVVAQQAFTKFDFTVKAEKNEKQFKAMSYQQFKAVCENDDTYKLITERHDRRSNYNDALEACGVTTTTYHDFHGPLTCHKEFDKKFFINLAFALALPYQSMVRLLAYNGYTLNSVGREFDDICKRAFKMGYSRKLTIEVIKMKNAEIKPRDEEHKVKDVPYNLIPNLEKIHSGKKKTTLSKG